MTAALEAVAVAFFTQKHSSATRCLLDFISFYLYRQDRKLPASVNLALPSSSLILSISAFLTSSFSPDKKLPPFIVTVTLVGSTLTAKSVFARLVTACWNPSTNDLPSSLSMFLSGSVIQTKPLTAPSFSF